MYSDKNVMRYAKNIAYKSREGGESNKVQRM